MVEHSNQHERELYSKVHPKAFLYAHLERGQRPDGRPILTSESTAESVFRKTILTHSNLSNCHASSLVRLGNTTMMCGIKAELCTPSTERPSQGYMVINVDLPALAHSSFKSGPPSDQASALSFLLQEVVLGSKILDLSSLCIQKGKSAWVLYADLACLNADGNLFDASVLALSLALRTCQSSSHHM